MLSVNIDVTTIYGKGLVLKYPAEETPIMWLKIGDIIKPRKREEYFQVISFRVPTEKDTILCTCGGHSVKAIKNAKSPRIILERVKPEVTWVKCDET